MSHIVSVKAKAVRPAVTPIQIARMQAGLWRLVCSASWFDRCWNALGKGRLQVVKRVDDALSQSGVYPPGGRRKRGEHRTLMARCKSCKTRWMPPQYVRGCGLCEDCVAGMEAVPEHGSWEEVPAESSMARTLRELEHYQVRLVEPSLPAEDTASLRREIDAYLKLHLENRRFFRAV